MVVTGTVDGVENVLSSALKTVTEGMEVAVFVVISHVLLVLLGRVDGSSRGFYSNFSSGLLRIRDLLSALTVGGLGLVGLLRVFGEVLSRGTELGLVNGSLSVTLLGEVLDWLTVTRLLYFSSVLTFNKLLSRLTVASFGRVFLSVTLFWKVLDVSWL